MASGQSNTMLPNNGGDLVTFEDVGLGITANEQPWIGTYDQQVNANMRALQTSTMRPFDVIEEPLSRASKVRSWAYNRRLKLVSVGMAIFAVILAGVWLALMINHHELTKANLMRFRPTTTKTAADSSVSTYGAQDIDITVMITQAPAPTTLAATTKTITVSQAPRSNPPQGESSLAVAKITTWTQTAQNGHCGFDTFTWALSADGTSTSGSMVGSLPTPTLYDWCKADGDNQAAFESFWHTTLNAQTSTETFEISRTATADTATVTSAAEFVFDPVTTAAPKITGA